MKERCLVDKLCSFASNPLVMGAACLASVYFFFFARLFSFTILVGVLLDFTTSSTSVFMSAQFRSKRRECDTVLSISTVFGKAVYANLVS